MNARELAAEVNRPGSDALGPARAALEAIEVGEGGPGGLNAFLARTDAASLSEPGPGPLSGVPVAVKDNLSTLDHPTTCGSRILEGYRAPYEATVVRKLRDAGAVVVGKTNMDEFAMGSSTENSAYGATRNPVRTSCVPGGSSGGSAAAVGAGYVPLALGSDTGGSVRQPASFCGVVGIKPTYGRVSRYGLVAYASSLDQVGTFGRNVRDAALALGVISGHDPRDATSADVPVPDFVAACDDGVAGLRVGVPEEYMWAEMDAAIHARMDEALAKLTAAGATIHPVSLPHTELAIPTYYVLAPAEASSNLARYDGVRYGPRAPADEIDELYARTRQRFGLEVRRRIVLGTYALSAGYYDAYYGAAQRARARIAGDFETAFGEVDVLFTPTSPTTAFEIGERVVDPIAMYMSDVFTVTANLAGVPGLSLPIGEADGLPVGGQLLAPWWGESRMLAAAAAIEAESGGAGA